MFEGNKQPLTPDDIFERNRKLQSIFVPTAQRCRDLIPRDPKTSFARFVHYTSAEAALNIIRKKQLWLRTTACMADYGEVHHGYSILLGFFSKRENKKSFYDAVNSVSPGAGEEALKNFDGWWGAGTIQFKTFIASLSEHREDEDLDGRLSMWRAYGTSAARVGLVLNIPERSKAGDEMKIIFSPVAYFKDVEAEQSVPEVIKQIKANADFLKTMNRQEIINWIFLMLLWGVTCVKHQGFSEEKEWRVVHCPQLFPTSLIIPATEIVGGVPQPIYKLSLDKTFDPILEDIDFARLFDRLIIGPSPYPTAMFDAFNEALSNAGVPEAGKKIVISRIPIRS